MFIVYGDRHADHPTHREMPGYGRNYPEVPDRVERIRFSLAAAGFPAPARVKDFGWEPIRRVHSAGLLDHLEHGFARHRQETGDSDPYIPHTFAVRGRRPRANAYPADFGAWAFDTGCPLFEGTFAVSWQSSQAALTAADQTLSTGETSYALIRPPGHHAGPDFHGGFCYTNHAAIAARYVQDRTQQRVALLDIDYHHGNGTQEIFYHDPTVFFASLHADPQVEYPFYWGAADEQGEGEGHGFNLNMPLPHGTDDAHYLAALDQVLTRISKYAPKFLVLSAGFDLMAGDPVPRNGGFRISQEGLQSIATAIKSLDLPTIIIQEGGYNLHRLGDYAVTLLRAIDPG